MEELLENIIEFINLSRENQNGSEITEVGKRLAQNYYSLKNRNVDVFKEFDNMFQDDDQLYLLILSVFFFLFKEREVLYRAEEILGKSNLPYHITISVLKQIVINRFRNGFEKSDYIKSKKLQRILVDRAKMEYNLELVRCCREKPEKRAILVTDVLLGDLHAPTQMVLEIAKSLKEDLGYEVMVVECVEFSYPRQIQDVWLYPYDVHFTPKREKRFKRIYKDAEINVYQQIFSEDHRLEIKSFFDEMKGWNADFVWKIGGDFVSAELFRDIAPMVSMPCTDGYAVSDADVLVSYMQNDKKMCKNMENVARDNNQRIANITLVLDYFDSGKIYKKSDFSIDEESFVVAIVGNRLDTEIDNEFIGVMKEILEREKSVTFLVVGKSSRDWSGGIFEGRVKKIGYCEDLYNVLKVADLFMNPRRKGGGGGAACCMKCGVPVLTLKNCDVAYVGEKFTCDSLSEYPDIIHRYITDRDFYEKKVNICQETWRHYMNQSFEKACKTVIQILDEE